MPFSCGPLLQTLDASWSPWEVAAPRDARDPMEAVVFEGSPLAAYLEGMQPMIVSRSRSEPSS